MSEPLHFSLHKDSEQTLFQCWLRADLLDADGHTIAECRELKFREGEQGAVVCQARFLDDVRNAHSFRVYIVTAQQHQITLASGRITEPNVTRWDTVTAVVAFR